MKNNNKKTANENKRRREALVYCTRSAYRGSNPRPQKNPEHVHTSYIWTKRDVFCLKEKNVTRYTRHMHAWQMAHVPQLNDIMP